MTEDQDAKDSHSDSGSKTFVNKNKDKKAKPHRPLTKIILRRLPSTMTEEAFMEQVSPIPEHDYFHFAKPDLSLGNNVYSRAYINFVNVDDIYLFRDKFDGYVFLDEKGVEYVGIVEYAPFQRIPKKKKKKDPKCGTLESDPIFQEFLENLNKDQETDNQPKLEYSYPINDSNDKKVQTTPLLEYLAARKQDKRGRDERRRRENDKRKMRIERKSKDISIKKYGDISEDEGYHDRYDSVNNKYSNHTTWYGEQRIYHKTKIRTISAKPKINEIQTNHGSEDLISTDSDWDSQFPALTMKTHNTFTLTSAKVDDKQDVTEVSHKSAGDTFLKEEDLVDNDVKKIQSREWDKEKSSDFKDDADSSVYESRSYKERKVGSTNSIIDRKKKFDTDKKSNFAKDDDEDVDFKSDKYDKLTDSPREQKSKRYSDARRERIKLTDVKSDKQAVLSKMMSSEIKTKSLNHDDIKPFTQLPQVKTDDLTRLLESKAKGEEFNFNKDLKESNEDISLYEKKSDRNDSKARRNSLEPGDFSSKEKSMLQKQKSLEDRSKSSEREGSEEKEKSESSDRRTERRIRNKDRPSLVIYQPGMGKFSKQRLAKEKDVTPRAVSDSEKRDT